MLGTYLEGRRREIVLAGLGFALVAAAVFGPHIWRGGLITDDWAYLSAYEMDGGHGFFGALASLDAHPALSRRPVSLAYTSFLQATFGDRAWPQLALTILLAVVTALALYALLRKLGLEPLHAAAIGALALLFPAADSTKLWIAAGFYSLGISFYLLGLLTALRAFEERGSRALWLHGISLALFLLSIATIEATGGVVLASGLLYLTRTERRPALRRWAADALVCIPWLLVVSRSDDAQSLSAWPHRASVLVREGLNLFGHRGLPLGIGAGLTLVLVISIATAALLAFNRCEPEDPLKAGLGRWLAFGAGAAVAIVAAYAVFVPSPPYYHPLGEGIDNRVNAVASIGIVVLAYSLIALVALLATRNRGRRGAQIARLLPALVAVPIGIYYASMVRDHADLLARASEQEREVRARIVERVAPLDEGSVMFVFGAPTGLARGVPVWGAAWDLSRALWLIWREPPSPPSLDPGVLAIPHSGGGAFICGEQTIALSQAALYPGVDLLAFRYADGVYFFDVPAGRLTKIPDFLSCAAAVAERAAGPPV